MHAAQLQTPVKKPLYIHLVKEQGSERIRNAHVYVMQGEMSRGIVGTCDRRSLYPLTSTKKACVFVQGKALGGYKGGYGGVYIGCITT